MGRCHCQGGVVSDLIIRLSVKHSGRFFKPFRKKCRTAFSLDGMLDMPLCVGFQFDGISLLGKRLDHCADDGLTTEAYQDEWVLARLDD
jgi:hypothetical protein